MVSCDDALLIFRKWVGENTPLLFRAQSPLYTHSVLGALEFAVSGVVRFRLQSLSYIDIHISSALTFEYFDPATQRSAPSNSIARSLVASLATGAGLIATNPGGETFVFLEVLIK